MVNKKADLQGRLKMKTKEYKSLLKPWNDISSEQGIE